MTPPRTATFLLLTLFAAGLIVLLSGCASPQQPILRTVPIGVTRADESTQRTGAAVATATDAAQEVDASLTEIRAAHTTLGDHLGAMAQTLDRLLTAPSTLGTTPPDEDPTIYLADPPPMQ